MAEFRLETERLVLRDWRVEDADDFHVLHSDPRVMATLGPLMDYSGTVALIADLQERARRNGGYTFWAVKRKSDTRVIGFCGLDRGEQGTIAGELEIGWRLAHDCWGMGYAYEGALACLDWAGGRFPDRRVFALTAQINNRSRRLMERLGMVHRAELDFDHPSLSESDPLRRHIVYVKEPIP